MMTRLRLLLQKEGADLRHQRTFLAVGILAPFLLYMVFYLIWSSDVTTPMEVVNRAGAAGEAFVRAMRTIAAPDGTPYLRVQPRDASVLGARAPGDYLCVLEIPPDFVPTAGGVRQYRVIAHYGAENENSVKNWINRLRAASVRFLADQDPAFRPIRVRERDRYLRDVPTRQGMAVRLLAYALLLCGSIFGGVVWTREYEENTVKLIRLAPLHPALVLMAKGAIAMLLTIVAGIFFTVMTALLTGAAPTATGPFLLVGLGVSLIGVVMGMLGGMSLRKPVPLFLAALVANLGMWVIGGGFGSLRMYPRLQQYAAYLLPYTHGTNLFWYTYFRGQPTPPWGSALALAAILAVAVLALAGVARFVLHKGR